MIPLNAVEMIPSLIQSASEMSDTNETKEPENVIPLQVTTRAQTVKEKENQTQQESGKETEPSQTNRNLWKARRTRRQNRLKRDKEAADQAASKPANKTKKSNLGRVVPYWCKRFLNL